MSKIRIPVVSILLLSLFSLFVSTGFAKNGKVQWSQKKVEISGKPGDSFSMNVQFESDKDLSNASLWVVPELQPFISVTPSDFPTIDAGSTYPVSIDVSIPEDSEEGSYEGTIHLGDGYTVPSGLKVTLAVKQPFRHGVFVSGTDPYLIPPDTTTEVCFGVELSVPQGVDGYIVILQEVNDLGIESSIDDLFLNDDGVGGDGIANDGLFYGCVSINTEGLQPGDCFSFQAVAISSEDQLESSVYDDLCVSNFPPTVSPSDLTNLMTDPESGEEVIANEMLVKFVEGTTEERIVEIIAGIGGEVVGTLPQIGWYQIRFESGLSPEEFTAKLSELRGFAEVESAEPNGLVFGSVIPDDEIYNVITTDPSCTTPNQDALKLIGVESAWDVTKGADVDGNAVIVAVVDSGIDNTHLDLNDKLATNGNHKDYITGSDNFPADDNGHGTHVAGIIAAETDNALDVAGIGWESKLLIVRVLNSDNNFGLVVGAESSAAAGIRYAASGHQTTGVDVKIINASFKKN